MTLRTFLILTGLLFIHTIYAQEQKLIDKQAKEILADFTHKFENLAEKDGTTLKFILSGTSGKSLIMKSNNDVYITAGLPRISSAQEAQLLFDKWVNVINKLDLNGAPLNSIDCKAEDELRFLCRRWKFDYSKFSMDPNYKPFTILIEIILYEGSYAGSLKIGSNL